MDHLDFIFQCFVHYSCVFYVQKCLLHAIWQISQLTFQKKRLLGPDHVQVFWKHKSIGNISQLETRPMIGQPSIGLVSN